MEERNEITKEYFEKIIMESSRELYQLSYSILKNDMDVQDAVAEAVATAWGRQNQIKDPQSLRPWLVTIVINISKNMYQERKRVHVMETNKIPLPVTEPEQEESEIWYIMTMMKEKYREILLLYYYEEYSVKEMAQKLELPEGTIKSRLFRAREELKNMLIDAGIHQESENEK